MAKESWGSDELVRFKIIVPKINIAVLHHSTWWAIKRKTNLAIQKPEASVTWVDDTVEPTRIYTGNMPTWWVQMLLALAKGEDMKLYLYRWRRSQRDQSEANARRDRRVRRG